MTHLTNGWILTDFIYDVQGTRYISKRECFVAVGLGGPQIAGRIIPHIVVPYLSSDLGLLALGNFPGPNRKSGLVGHSLGVGQSPEEKGKFSSSSQL